MLDGLSLGKTVATAAPPDVFSRHSWFYWGCNMYYSGLQHFDDSERLNLLLVDQESAESEKGPESKKGNFYSW